jgi:hypothetical protein
MIRPVTPALKPYLEAEAGAAINKGQILVYSSGEAVPAAEGLVSAATIMGVAVEDAASGEKVYIYPPDQQFEFEIYQGSSTDTAALTDQGELYDIYVDGAVDDGSGEGEMYVDLNDTTGGFISLSAYDNVRRVAIGTFILASRQI